MRKFTTDEWEAVLHDPVEVQGYWDQCAVAALAALLPKYHDIDDETLVSRVAAYADLMAKARVMSYERADGELTDTEISILEEHRRETEGA